MKRSINNILRWALALSSLALLAACGSDNSNNADVPAGSFGPFTATVTGSNTMPITLATPGTPGAYVNEPTVSVKICVPGSTMECQIIDNVLLDTGSFGLRIFQSVVTIPLVNETTSVPTAPPSPAPPDTSSGTVAECAQFGTGMTWGPVATADVYLGGEPVASLSGAGTPSSTGVPIQLINIDYETIPAVCVMPDKTPESAGYNGILGVGQFGTDCAGSNCEAFLGYDPYYKCDANECNIITTGSTGPDAAFTTSMMVTNPATAFSNSTGTDINGLAVVLPAIPAGGATAVTGTLIFGIGTASNNNASGTVTLNADGNGFISTQFNGTTGLEGFIDSGSNGLYFPGTPALPACGDAQGFFCSNPIQQLNATMASTSGNGAASVAFEVVNADGLFNSGFSAFPTLAGGGAQDQFDWGLPFFFGRTVYVGFAGKSSSLGTGPYWAF
jgi:Protein of unknown function (DUF3443)